MEIRFVHRTCSGVVVNFCLVENLASLLTFTSPPSRDPTHLFSLLSTKPTESISVLSVVRRSCLKNRTRHRNAKCVEEKGEWGGDISPLVHQEIMRSVPTPQPVPVRRPRTKKITTLVHFAISKVYHCAKVRVSVWP